MRRVDRIKLNIRRAIFGSVAAIFVVLAPSPAYLSAVSAASADDSQKCSPVVANPTGVSRPTGASAGTFTYNGCTGLWHNDYYTWSPATRQYSPLPDKEPTYTCNQSNGTWKETKWQYVASHNGYENQTFSVASAPSSAGICSPPAPTPAATVSQNPPASGGSATINSSNSNDTSINNSNDTTLTNQIDSNATSGNVTSVSNTVTGDATSGNASASATIINSVNSDSSLGDGRVVTFTKNIDGDVQGDLMINPNSLQPANIDLNNFNNLTVNNQTSGHIENNVNLDAKSGDVNMSRNTKAGDATSGNARAVAEVVNTLNSLVSAKQSFIGTININGNLDGNVLVPPSFLSSLIASNAPHTTVTLNNDNTVNVTDNSTTNIDNQVSSLAKSGQVVATGNTKSGDLTSGSASTNVEVFNLTGHSVVGRNSLLVFVNVVGKWVGVIMDAPAGSTSALLGGNITSNTDNKVNVNSTTNNTISNNISANASSGNVTLADNTSVGNGTSGNASTTASLANLSNDSLSLSGWFGVLFINVFGSWHGNFGVASLLPSPSNSSGGHNPDSHTKPPATFKFVPTSSTKSVQVSAANPSVSSNSNSDSSARLASANVAKHILGSSVSKPSLAGQISKDKASNGDSNNWFFVSAGLLLAGSLMYLASRAPIAGKKQ